MFYFASIYKSVQAVFGIWRDVQYFRPKMMK